MAARLSCKPVNQAHGSLHQTRLLRHTQDLSVMAALISLDNQAFWKPSAPQPANPRHAGFSELLTSQSQGATLPALDQSTSPSHDAVLISSDEESDSHDVEDADDDKSDMADYLPSLAEIMSKTAANFAPVPGRIHRTDIESRRPSVVSQPCESVVHENTTQPDSETTPDDALDTALHTALRLDPYENDWVQPERENESRSASADGALVDVAASASHEADIPPVEGCGHVMEGSPADLGGGVTPPEPIRPPRTRLPKSQSARRRRGRASTTHSVVTAASDEERPTYKRRKVAASSGLGRGARSALSPAQKPRTRASGEGTTRRSSGASSLDEDRTTDHVNASYQEWSLSDAVLQRIQVNSRATLQLQFTWATPCASHTAPAARPAAQSSELTGTHRGRGASTRASKRPTSNRGLERADSGNTGGENDVHIVASLLARWKRGTYFLKWADGTTSWEPKRNFFDRQMIDDFEATYRGFDAGIDVLASRTWKGRQQWRVHWHGRPVAEDCWVDGKLMDPARVEKVQASGFDNLRE